MMMSAKGLQPFASILLVLTVITCNSSGAFEAKKYYVTPNNSTLCPVGICYALEDVLQDPTMFFTTNTTIVLLEGIYYISNETSSTVVSGISNFKLIGGCSTNESESISVANNVNAASTIYCTGNYTLAFVNSSQLTIANVNIVSCGFVRVSEDNTAKPTLPSRRLADAAVLAMIAVKDIELLRVTFESSQVCVALMSVEGNVSISNAIITYCNDGVVIDMDGNSSISMDNLDIAGGARGISIHCNMCAMKSQDTFVHISNSRFRYVMGVVLNVSISEACSGSLSGELQVKIDHIYIYWSSSGLSFYGESEAKVTVMIADSRIISLYGLPVYSDMVNTTIIDTSIIESASAITVQNTCTLTLLGYNFLGYNYCGHKDDQSIVNLYGDAIMILEGHTIFYNNRCLSGSGAVYSSKGEIHFQGFTEFLSNQGFAGGAIGLFAGSTLYFDGNGTQVIFDSNAAETFGGAIYVDGNCLGAETECFFYVPPELLGANKVVLAKNQAFSSGTQLYGGSVDSCHYKNAPPGSGSNFASVAFNETFRINATNATNTSAAISSPATLVCLCDEQTQQSHCGITSFNVTAYPGQSLAFAVLTVGQRFGLTPGIVFSSLILDLADNKGQQVVPVQKDLLPEASCTVIRLTLLSTRAQDVLLLSVDSIPLVSNQVTAYSLRSLVINIDWQACPIGFTLSHGGECVCIPELSEHHIMCDINTLNITRPGNSWIGPVESRNESWGNYTEILYYRNCPAQYCKSEELTLALNEPDEQCAYHRMGFLCSQCGRGLSSILGSSQCKKCSNTWILLLIPFALSGLALVAFLFFLNLTVAVGTINGLIFYANIIRADQSTFFKPSNTNGFVDFINVFIAWVNLDLGIETCFADGLNQYIKVWLQFVFPLYIISIVLVIIVASRYSSRAAKLCPPNVVPVLATLLLLSYAKLLRTKIAVFSFAIIEYANGARDKVWYEDATIGYLSFKHTPMFLGAVALLIVISLPFTFLLLFHPCLQKLPSSRRPLSWLIKLKPLFDAYMGPYKDHCRWWSGAMLLVRVLLFTATTVNRQYGSSFDTIAVLLTSLCLFAVSATLGGVYTSWLMNLIEHFYLLNLGAFDAATLYSLSNHLNNHQTYQTITVSLTVGSAFLAFLGILCYHSLVHVVPVKKIGEKISGWRSRARTPVDLQSRAVECGHTSVRLTGMHSDRELNESWFSRENAPLLEDSNQLRESILATT